MVLLGIGGWLLTAAPPQSTQTEPPPSTPEESPSPDEEPQAKTGRLVMVGDMLIHDTIYEDFRTDQGFDFRPAFHSIKPAITQADFAIVNQETPLGGEELGLSGLYQANSPQELGGAYVDTGFNMIQLANNHANDRGDPGIKNTLEFWSRYSEEVITSGLYKEPDSQPPISTITRNGITASFLSYTYGSNLGDSEAYQLNYIDKNRIERDVARAQEQSDVVIVGMHWGVELDRHPSRRQRELARFMNGLGVDIIYGTHPHVLQPPEKITGESGHHTAVFYSLGNFLSIHTEKLPHTLTGMIAGVDITKDEEGSVSISEPFALPTWNYFSPQQTDFLVMPFENVSEPDFRYGDWQEHKQVTSEFLRSEWPELEIVGLDYFRQ